MKTLINAKHRSKSGRQVGVMLATIIYLGAGLVPVAHASDTEVYARKLAATSELAPTLMMMIDTSLSMNSCLLDASGGCTGVTRIQGLLNAMEKMLVGTAEIKPIPGYVKLGFSRFQHNANDGGLVQYPARPLDAFVDINPNGSIGSQPQAKTDDAEQSSSGVALYNASLGLGGDPVGIRFPEVYVPKGATINEAYIEFTASQDHNGKPSAWQIQIQDIDDAPTFGTTAAEPDVDSRTYAPAQALVAITDSWNKDQVYSVSVMEPLKYIVNRSDWCGGNAVALRLTEAVASNPRDVYSLEGSAAQAPRLVVNYSIDPKSTDSCIVAPFFAESRIQNPYRDVEYYEGSTTVTPGANSLSFARVNAAGKRNQVALRFGNFTKDIFQGATIVNATLYGTDYENRNSVPAIEVAAFDTASLLPFCSTTTTCAVPSVGVINGANWVPPSNKTVTNRVDGIPVTDLVQGLVNKPGWQPTNAMGFRLRSTVTNSSNLAAFWSADAGIQSRAPLLKIEGRQRFTDLSKLKTVREEILEELKVMAVDGNSTPLGAAYAETMRYMLGRPVYAPSADSRVTTSDKLTYISPVKASSQCAGNYIFALSDGLPNTLAQVHPNTDGFVPDACPSSYKDMVYGSGLSENWSCAMSAAEWGVSPANQVKSRIRTNTVLYGDKSPENIGNMTLVSDFGGGKFYQAGDEAALVKALVDTVNSLLDVSGTITAPGVAVNQFNRLTNLDQAFYAVFDPDVQRAFWPGNVKRYRLDIANEALFDVNGELAVDPATSFFKSGTQSWWSTVVDGDKARLGGAANVLPAPESRRIFTYIGSLPSGQNSLTRVDLTNGTFVSKGKSLTGITDDVEFSNLINWFKGYQVPSLTGGAATLDPDLLRKELGGALHSSPIVVNYGSAGSSADLQDNTIFVSTLEGVLHAIDTKTGNEEFAFIPGEKIAALPKLYANPVQENPEFGMDLTWAVYRKDDNRDGQISGSDKVYIYGGMRMGGSNYYALNVTDRSNPRLQFALEGGTGDFSKMGQTWSEPAVGAMRVNDVVTPVIVFGGGYDPQHETENSLFSGDSVGNQIYIVHAETGDLIWSGGGSGAMETVPDMKFSVPTKPKLFDSNGDGIADHIYFGDLGGQVFRVDIDNRAGAASLVARVKTLAKLGQTGGGSGVSDQRRFYEQPTVALFVNAAGQYYAGIGLGSGYRSHPLNEATNDYFFLLFDSDISRPDILASTGTMAATMTLSDLDAITPSSTATTAGKSGWYMDLPTSGEKIITSGLLYKQNLVFVSYIPSIESGDVCAPVIGSSLVYQVELGKDGAVIKTSVQPGPLGLGASPQLIRLPVCPPGVPCDDGGASGSGTQTGISTGTDIISLGEDAPPGLDRKRWYEKTKR